MSKKKAYILAFQKVTNYGAVLQIYALKTVLERLGLVVETINYVPRWMKVTIKNQPNIKSYFKRKIMNLTFRSFFKKLNLTSPYYEKESMRRKLQDAEFYFVGSDQVWNQKIIGDDLTYFLDFAPEESKKIGYAISMGNTKFSEDFKDKVIPYIRRFNFVSARESFVSEYLKSIFPDLEVPVVLDPTLLLDAKDYKNISDKKNYKEPYIAVYAAMYDKNFFKLAFYLRRKLSLPLVNLGHHFSGADKHEYIWGPSHFLNRISQASLVLTNSFHGTAFSILFKKNFITVPNKNVAYSNLNARFIELTNKLNLSDRIASSIQEVNKLLTCNIDYTHAYKLLQIEREKSLNFLKKVLCE